MADNGMESFVYVFAFGVGLFFLAFLMLGDVPVSEMDTGTGQTPAGGTYTPGGSSKGFQGLVYIPSFYLEAEKRQGVRTIDLGGFTVGYVKTMKALDTRDSIIVDSGVFSAHSYSYTFSGEGEYALMFDVNRTNKYGRLRVFLNDKKIYEGIPTGHVYLPLGNLSSVNTVQITAESSGPRIWAPTTYEITNLRLEVYSWEKKEKEFSFTMSSSEYNGFDRLEIHLETLAAQRDGPLYTILNGETLSEGRPLGGRLYSVETRERSIISSGTNYLKFSTGQNASYEFSAGEIRIFYSDVDKPATRQQEFYLSSSTYSTLGERVPLYARISEMDGKAGIRVNGKEIQAELKEGDNLVPIPREYLKRGDRNTIEFYTLGRLRVEKAYIP